MTVAKTLAYFDTAKNTAVKSFIVQTRGGWSTPGQGRLTKGEGSVQLTSSLR